MSKTLLLASTALLAITGAAAAADLPRRAAPPILAPVAPIFTWTGAYLGINAGYAFAGDTRFDRTTGDLPNNNAALVVGLRPVAVRVRDEGFTAGGQIGYNYQLGNVVVGVEADAAYTDLDRVVTLSNTTNFGPLVTPGPVAVTRTNQFRGGLDYLGTVRGRLGYAFGRVLVFGTGGFAYGNVNNSVTYFIPGGTTPFFQGGQNDLKTGYAYGGGIEYAIPTESFLSRLNLFNASAVTIKAEYLHYELGGDRFAIPGVNGGPGNYSARARNEGDLVRGGINYKFGTF